MTLSWTVLHILSIIPYQELLGNYDNYVAAIVAWMIIPYQELLGNYDEERQDLSWFAIIPYQELLGNYDGHCRFLAG